MLLGNVYLVTTLVAIWATHSQSLGLSDSRVNGLGIGGAAGTAQSRGLVQAVSVQIMKRPVVQEMGSLAKSQTPHGKGPFP
jgi:hypothetical protein